MRVQRTTYTGLKTKVIMESKVVSIKKLTENNPTLCLSALRVFGKCHQCPQYKKSPDKLKCNPVISTDVISLTERRKKLLQEMREIDQALSGKEE